MKRVGVLYKATVCGDNSDDSKIIFNKGRFVVLHWVLSMKWSTLYFEFFDPLH